MKLPDISSERTNLRETALGLSWWLLTVIFLACNFGFNHIQLMVDMSTDAVDTAQVFYSPGGRWNETDSKRFPLAPGNTQVVFALTPIMGGVVRFDPGQRAAVYRISAVRWRLDSGEIEVPLDKLINIHAAASTATLVAGKLVVTARDNDPQLTIPAPPWRARMQGMGLVASVALVTLLLLAYALSRRISPVRLAGAFLGIWSVVYVASCMFIGPRLPLLDDWRYVVPGAFNLIDGGWHWLRVVGNDTYFLTNQVLDFLVLNLTGADFFWLRTVAATVLLLQLAVQYHVLARVGQAAQFVTATSITLGIWSLSAGAYWGGTAIAYQQALPTVFGTLMLLQLIAADGSLRTNPSRGIILACCLASGLAYISGGVMIISLGIAYLLAGNWTRRKRSTKVNVILLLGVGMFLLSLQFALVCIQQGSLLDHTHHAASVYPNDARFWVFFVALYGRALGYLGTWLPADILLTVFMLLPAFVLGLQRLRALFRDADEPMQPAWTMLALYAGIGSASYAAIVAFGRAGFAPADAPATLVAAMGKGRFHYWPIAAMLPYAWLGWAVLLQRLSAYRRLAYCLVGTLMIVPKSPAQLDNVSALRAWNERARMGARCAVEHMPDVEAQRPVICTDLTGVSFNIGPTLAHLRAIHSRTFDELMADGTTTKPLQPDEGAR